MHKSNYGKWTFLIKVVFWLILWDSGWPKNMSPIVCHSFFLPILNFLSFLHFSVLDVTFISRRLFVILCVCLGAKKNKSFIWETASSGFLSLSLFSSGSLKWVIPFVFYSLQGIWCHISLDHHNHPLQKTEWISLAFVLLCI